MKKTLLTLFSIGCLVFSMNAQTVWAAKTAIDPSTGNNPYTIASGLIDADTELDILIGTDTDHIIVWYKGNGDGTFVKQTAITNTLTNIVGIKLVDLDSDTDLDILAVGFGSYNVGYGTPSALVWFQNDGNGNFGSEQLITDAFDGMSGLFTGTIDSGSTIDIAVTSVVDGEVFWLSNDGSGNFSVPTNSSIDNTLNSPGVINMKDIDGDGDLDAVVATAAYAGSDVVEIYRNDLVPGGTVLFTKDATSVATGKVGIFNANFEDLDGDSNLDILVTEVSFGGGPVGNFYWYEEDGMGGYTETVFTTTINNPSVAQFKDVDEDGINDIILSSGTQGAGTDLVWYKNNGAGSFGSETIIDNTQSQVFVYAVNDFDNDGDNDIASCSYNSDSLNYFENLFETLSVPELNGNAIKIFPNPTKDILNFEGFTATTIDVSIFDIQGKSVLKASQDTNKTLDVSSLANGLYTITINGKMTLKFIKE